MINNQRTGSVPQKYASVRPVDLPDRTWPSRIIEKAPRFCSVDLRDGNQALVIPMEPEKKARMFRTLIQMGFREIEVGFPSASQPDYDFVRWLADPNVVPSGTWIQILSQARSHLIERSFEAIQGLDQVIFHVYNSTSPAQREYVFQKSRDEVIQIAVDAVRQIKQLRSGFSGEMILEYSPESFSATEPEFALEITHAVMEEWAPFDPETLIINLPSTVEVTTPNLFADQIEWFCRNLNNRKDVIISVHPHNDRGTAVAAAEMSLLAGADRLEGTLFGNGERTGNVDLVTVGLNMFSQGVDPGIDYSNLPEIRQVYEQTTGMTVPPRQPYAGELVFTAFSGSHQDAIRKSLNARKNRTEPGIWDIPYLPVDPADIGRRYEKYIRINSQSGKGGVAYVLEDQGLDLSAIPVRDLMDFASLVQSEAESKGSELDALEILNLWSRRKEGNATTAS
ncbi:MAG TPA: 2-isopropylmalate synthase [Leptospiraceae bacterium]|nr:2-isopropylmalate synthase [Spirochaetaceae bacterium]HBS04187.1 2-isopropylmalate synthase [Leptospiraceae bacterium]